MPQRGTRLWTSSDLCAGETGGAGVRGVRGVQAVLSRYIASYQTGMRNIPNSTAQREYLTSTIAVSVQRKRHFSSLTCTFGPWECRGVVSSVIQPGLRITRLGDSQPAEVTSSQERSSLMSGNYSSNRPVWLAIILIFSVLVGAGTALLFYLAGAQVAGILAASGGAFVATVTLCMGAWNFLNS